MTLIATNGATPSTNIVNEQIARNDGSTTFLSPTELSVKFAEYYDLYARQGILLGGNLAVGGTKSILEAGFISDNTSATVNNIAAAICGYWATNITPGIPTHGGVAVQSVVINSMAKVSAMQSAIENFITTEPDLGWEGFYNVTQSVVVTFECAIVELLPPNGSPVTFMETIT